MKLLSPRAAVSRPSPPLADAAFTACWAAWLIALELVGRRAESDLQDAFAAGGLGLALAVLAARHRARPLPWLRRLIVAGKRRLSRLRLRRYEHGIDLRGAPAYPRAVPPQIGIVVGLLLAWGVAAGAAWAFLPGGWRPVTAGAFYLAHAAGMALLWVGLLGTILLGVYVPVFLFQGSLERIERPADRRAAEAAVIVAYALLAAMVAGTLPVAAVLVLCAVVGLTALAVAARRWPGEPSILWRATSRKPVRAVPLPRLVAGATALAALLAFDLLLTACGGQLFGAPAPSESLPLTGLLGAMAAWLLPGAAALAAIKTLAGVRSDPARRTPPTLHLTGGAPADRQRAAETARAWGWDVRAGGAQPLDVPVHLVATDAQSHAEEFEPTWPLPLVAADFGKRLVKERLERRDEIQMRRVIFRGLAGLLKEARKERGKGSAGGVWFAPHWWFVDALSRDDGKKGRDAETMHSVGEPFSRVFGPRPRQHLHAVLRSTRVDMVFLEDGVSAKAVERVLRALFELYDVHAGKRMAEEHHFRGVPKVRVMIHEYTPGRRFPSTSKYREPSFADLSRARVLHVFKDRGGLEEEEEAPFDSSWEPAPAMGVG